MKHRKYNIEKKSVRYIMYGTISLLTVILAFVIMESSSFHFNFAKFSLLNYPPSSVFWGGLLIVGLLYGFVIALFSNIFLVSALFISIFMGLALSNTEKLTSTGNPIFWSDIVMGFHPIEMFSLVDMSSYLIPIVVISIVMIGLIYFQFFIWNKKIKPRFAKKTYLISRGITVVVTGTLLCVFLYMPQSSVSKTLLRKNNENHKGWNMGYNYRTNGTVYSLIRNIHKVATEAPAGYSEEKMNGIAMKYRAESKVLNKNRQNKGKDRKVILMLSETFSDPENIKGFALDGNPVPNIQKLKEDNPSGTVIVPGIGGGTSDTEWTVLSSLNTRMLSGEINSPYTDFYYGQKNPQTILQLLDEEMNQTVAVHATPPIYYRNGDVYQNIGIRKYYSTKNVKNFKPISKEKNFISDKSFFNVLLEKIKDPKNKVVIGQSMQNHQPYTYEYFADHRFSAKGKGTKEELEHVRNYAQGLSITDKEIMVFLDNLEKLDEDVSLVFYGGHIPVAYNPFASENSYPTMHSGDYFIYNNHQYDSMKNGVSELENTHSSSFLGNKILENLDMKLSPFYTLTYYLEKELPIISKDYLGTKDKEILEEELTDDERELLLDYQLVTHDMLSGQQYLLESNFFTVE